MRIKNLKTFFFTSSYLVGDSFEGGFGDVYERRLEQLYIVTCCAQRFDRSFRHRRSRRAHCPTPRCSSSDKVRSELVGNGVHKREIIDRLRVVKFYNQ